MKNNAIKFLEDNKKEIFIYFRENSPHFPSCCVDIAMVLQHFIKGYFGEDFEIIKGKKKLYPNRINFHVWLQHDSDIIDFSLFQFYIGNNKFRKVSNDDTYNYCMEEIQNNVVEFSLNYYNKLFKDLEKVDATIYLDKYKKPLWGYLINKDIPALESLHEYFEYCKAAL